MANRNYIILEDKDGKEVLPVTDGNGVFVEGGTKKLENKLIEIDSKTTELNEQLDTIALSKTNWINVVENGVDNSGLKDVTIKLQDLIDLYEGYVIYLPKGTYLISQIKLPKGTTLLGDGIDSTILKGTSATDMIILKDYLSAHVRIKDIFIDGDYKANRGVFAYKEQYSLEYLDNAFNMDNVYVKRCNIANVQIGKDGTASIMECKITNVKCEQSKGYGIYLANKCTDSYFEGLYCASNLLDGYYIEGFNLKFVNCKACWNGTKDNKKNGFYVYKGGFITFSNCEVQDNYGHGLMVDTTTDLNVNIITDRNGNGGFDEEGNQIAPTSPTQYGIYIKDSYYIKISTVARNGLYTSLNKYSQKGAIGILNSYFITANIQASNHPYYFLVEDKLSYNLDINVNGTKWQNVLPSITINDTTQDGVTFKQINSQTFSIEGSTTVKTKLDLLGMYGNTTPLLTLPKGSMLKVKNSNKEPNVFLLIVGNRTSILAQTTKEAYVLIENETELSEIAFVVESDKTVKTLVSPTLEIIPSGSE